MFRGHYEHAIDGKGRTSLPARFRHLLGGDDARLVIAPGLVDACLDVFPMSAWEELERRVAQRPRWDPDLVLFRRRYLSAAVECELDAHGRALIPAHLREHASLARDVLWAGVGTTMELWARERWEAARTLSDADLQRWRLVISEKLDL